MTQVRPNYQLPSIRPLAKGKDASQFSLEVRPLTRSDLNVAAHLVDGRPLPTQRVAAHDVAQKNKRLFKYTTKRIVKTLLPWEGHWADTFPIQASRHQDRVCWANIAFLCSDAALVFVCYQILQALPAVQLVDTSSDAKSSGGARTTVSFPHFDARIQKVADSLRSRVRGVVDGPSDIIPGVNSFVACASSPHNKAAASLNE